MKICHVTCVHQQNDVRIFSKECTSLAGEPGYEVYLSAEGESRKANNVNIIGNGELPGSRVKRLFQFSKKVVDSALKVEADLYHLHDPELLRHAMKFKKTGAKVIFDSHENVLDEIEEKQYLPTLVKKIAKIYFAHLLNYTLKRIDGVVIVTPQQEKGYKALNRNIVLIPNYPIVDTADDEKVQKKPGRIAFAGLVSDLWSQEEIIRALEDVDGAEYRIFGPADEEYIEKLSKLPGWNKAEYFGVQPFERVQEELKSACCTVALLKPCRNTFYTEGTMGNTKLFESMYNETPVIATSFELWKDVVEKNQCGFLIDPNNVDEIRGALKKMMSLSVEDISEMGRNGKQAVIRDYSWEKAYGELRKLYKSL